MQAGKHAAESDQQVRLMAGAAFRVRWNDIGIAVLCLPIDAGKNPARKPDDGLRDGVGFV
jgi:hypothetical protein